MFFKIMFSWKEKATCYVGLSVNDASIICIWEVKCWRLCSLTILFSLLAQVDGAYG